MPEVLVDATYDGDTCTWRHVDRNTQVVGEVFLTINPGDIVRFAGWKGGYYARRVRAGQLTLILVTADEIVYPPKLPQLTKGRRSTILPPGMGLVETNERQARRTHIFRRWSPAHRR